MSAPAGALITTAAAELLARLQERHGPVMFHQSGGCCDGSSPMCYPRGDFLVGDRDSDEEAGRAAGCRTLRVGPDAALPDLAAAAAVILGWLAAESA